MISRQGKMFLGAAAAFLVISAALNAFVFEPNREAADNASLAKQQESEQRAIERQCESKVAAYRVATERVKEQLVSPSTASFPDLSSTGVSVSTERGCIHRIAGYVDSENGFGAQVRTSYEASVQNIHGTRDYRVLSLSAD